MLQIVEPYMLIIFVQVRRARVLMEQVWQQGKNGVGWETLLGDAEFCG